MHRYVSTCDGRMTNICVRWPWTLHAWYKTLFFEWKEQDHSAHSRITRRCLRKNWKWLRKTDEQKQTRSGLQHNGSFVAASFWDPFPAAATSGRVGSGVHSMHLSFVQYAVGCHPTADTRPTAVPTVLLASAAPPTAAPIVLSASTAPLTAVPTVLHASTAPPTAVPTVLPASTAPPTALPTVLPASTAPPTAVPTILPASTAPPTAVPIVLSASTAPPTAVPTVLPASTAPPTAVPTVLPASTAPPTAVPTVLPASTAPPTAVLPVLPASTAPPTAVPIVLPASTAPPTAVPPVLPASTAPPTAVPTVLPAPTAPPKVRRRWRRVLRRWCVLRHHVSIRPMVLPAVSAVSCRFPVPDRSALRGLWLKWSLTPHRFALSLVVALVETRQPATMLARRDQLRTRRRSRYT